MGLGISCISPHARNRLWSVKLPCGIAHHNGIGLYRFCHDATCTDNTTITKRDGTQDDRVRTNINPIPDFRDLKVFRFSPNRGAMSQDHTGANLYPLVYNQALTMEQFEPGANAGAQG